MKSFIVGVLSFFENENKLFQEQAENGVEAMKNALISFTTDSCKVAWVDKNNPTEEEKRGLEESLKHQTDWNDSLDPESTIEDVKEAAFNMEIAITTPLEL